MTKFYIVVYNPIFVRKEHVESLTASINRNAKVEIFHIEHMDRNESPLYLINSEETQMSPPLTIKETP